MATGAAPVIDRDGWVRSSVIESQLLDDRFACDALAIWFEFEGESGTAESAEMTQTVTGPSGASAGSWSPQSKCVVFAACAGVLQALLSWKPLWQACAGSPPVSRQRKFAGKGFDRLSA